MAATASSAKPVPAPWRDAVEGYIEAQFNLGRSTESLRLRREHLRHVARELRHLAPTAVTSAELVEWFNQQDHWAAETRRSYRGSLRSFFEWAQGSGLTETNPASALPLVKPAAAAPRPAPDLAVRTAVASADPRAHLMLRLGTEAGLRRAEIARVHTRDIKNGESGPQLLVHGKGNKFRLVPITDNLAAAIRAGAAGHTPGAPAEGWLFPGPNSGHLSPKWVGSLISGVLPDRWTAHTLRHRFGTRAYAGSKDICAVQHLLGHSNVTTTQRYVAVQEDQLRAAMMAAVARA